MDLLVPVKPLTWAKTRLRGAADGGSGASKAHARLVIALARDTVTAAVAVPVVRQVVVICSDGTVCAALADDGVQTIPDQPAAGLNPALRYGEAVLRASDPTATVGALQADLPALRPEELDHAIRAALASSGRAFCTDRTETGTTLLLAPPGQLLGPCFGPASAAAHRATGARKLTGFWPGLRCDVDTAADLTIARGLGLGRFTSAALARN
ncbi:MAG: 2-phospho-L-lactate guanylyltransferase [Pseudonocardiaceae bacterium]